MVHFKMVSAAKLTTPQFPEPIGAGSLNFSEQYLWAILIDFPNIWHVYVLYTWAALNKLYVFCQEKIQKVRGSEEKKHKMKKKTHKKN